MIFNGSGVLLSASKKGTIKCGGNQDEKSRAVGKIFYNYLSYNILHHLNEILWKRGKVMKILYKTMWLCLTVVCLCTLAAAPSAAKVCFVGEPDCAGGGSFEEYNPDENKQSCLDEGYILKSDCAADPSKHITGYCPYDNSYVMCCGNEYVYDACVYPHVTVGKCGSKYKCQCDPEKYPYTEEACHTQFKFSNPGGTACTQIDAGTTSTIKTLYYSACLCERGLYPYSKDDCQTVANADVNGDPCQDSQGNQYWDSCKCSNPPYKWESIDCEFGGKGKACVQGGVYFFQDCCSCAAFPAEGERGVRPNDPYATKWTTCDCPRKGRFKITQCSQGWQPNKDGSACERISCENAVKLFFSKAANKKNYASYGVFTGNKLVHYQELTEAEKAKLPEAQQTYAVGAEIEANKASAGVLAKNVSVSTQACIPPSAGKCVYARCVECTDKRAENVIPKICSTTNKGRCFNTLSGRYCKRWEYQYDASYTSFGYEVGCTKAADIYSGAYFGTLASTDDHKMLQEACGAHDPEKTVVQRISVSGSSFPNDTAKTVTISVYGAELYFYSGVNVNRVLSLNNTNVGGYGAVFNKMVNLTRSASKPNGTATRFAMSSSTFKSKLTSNGYNFDIGSLYFEVPESYKNKEFAELKFQGGETVEGGSIYLYPSIQDFGNDWGTYVSFKGPSAGSSVNVYSNVYIGYQGYVDSGYDPSKGGKGKGTRVMQVKLSGNLVWNMYEGSRNYKVAVTPNSQLISVDYGSGNFAKIQYNSTSNWRHCSGETRMLYGDRKKNAKFCTGDCHTYMNYKNYNEAPYYFMTTIDKDQKRTLEYYVYYIKTGTNSRCNCYKPTTDVNWSDGYFYIDGNTEWKQYLVNCGS